MTLNAAWVLRRHEDAGSVEVGKRADLVLLDGPLTHVPYRFGRNPVAVVVAAARSRGCARARSRASAVRRPPTAGERTRSSPPGVAARLRRCERTPVTTMPDPDRVALAAEAFIYGFPLVFNLRRSVGSCARAWAASPPCHSTRSGSDQLAGPDDTFVSINNDTVYSIAQLDVSGGRSGYDVPDTADRYYVLQFVDAWTNNFAYVGHRATGHAQRARSCSSRPAGTARREGEAP